MADNDEFPPKDRRIQRYATTATIAFFAFVVGFAPMWLTARARTSERNAVQQELRLTEIQNALAAAAIHAGQGDHDAAHVAASSFYMKVQSEVNRSDSASASARRGALQEMLAERDEIMRFLARRDAAVAERLATACLALAALRL